jgi:hypothetical protein
MGYNQRYSEIELQKWAQFSIDLTSQHWGFDPQTWGRQLKNGDFTHRNGKSSKIGIQQKGRPSLGFASGALSKKKKTYSDSRFRISGGFPIGKISQITLNKPR